MQFLSVLAREQRLIGETLGVLARADVLLTAGRDVPADILTGSLRFLDVYAGACHRTKEEHVLFPLLSQLDIGPDHVFMNALLAQHRSEQMYLARLHRATAALAAGDHAVIPGLAADLRAYVELMREHIRIEAAFFDAATRGRISEMDDRTIVSRFEAIDRRTCPPATQARFVETLAHYRRRLGV